MIEIVANFYFIVPVVGLLFVNCEFVHAGAVRAR